MGNCFVEIHENSSLGLNLKNGALRPAPVCFIDSKQESYIGFVPQKAAMDPNGTNILNISRRLSSRAQEATCVRTHFANQNIEWKNGQVRDAVRCCAMLCDVVRCCAMLCDSFRSILSACFHGPDTL